MELVEPDTVLVEQQSAIIYLRRQKIILEYAPLNIIPMYFRKYTLKYLDNESIDIDIKKYHLQTNNIFNI